MNWKIKEFFYINGWLLTIISVVNGGRRNDSTSACQGLTAAASSYLQNAFGVSPKLRWANYNARDLKICSGSNSLRTCCSEQHEKMFMDNAFKFITRYSPRTLSDDIKIQSATLHGQVQTLLTKTKEKTIYRLNNTYGIPMRLYYPAFTNLFTQLSSYLNPTDSFDPQTESPVLNVVEQFFIDLFPPVFVYYIGGVVTDGNQNFLDCLKREYKNLSPIPFHNYPSVYGRKLDSVLTTFRALLGSLRVSANLLNRSMNSEGSNNCLKGLVRLRLCHLCSGQNVSLPCSNVCLNVHRGCFAHLLLLRRGWTELIKVTGRMVDNLTTKYKIMEELRQLEHTIHRSISQATHTVASYTSGIVDKCVTASQPSNSSSSSNDTIDMKPVQDHNIYDGDLQPRLNIIRSILTNNQLFFDHLPEQYCKGLRSHNCWNGTHQSPTGYSRRLLKFTTSEQPVNPEVQSQAPNTFSLMQVQNENLRLLHLAKSLSGLMREKLAQRTYPNRDRLLPERRFVNMKKRGQIDGSGWGKRLPVDDEDVRMSKDYGSGSGAGMGNTRGNRLGSQGGEMNYVPSPTDINIEQGQRKGGNSAAHLLQPKLGLFLNLVLIFRVYNQ